MSSSRVTPAALTAFRSRGFCIERSLAPPELRSRLLQVSQEELRGVVEPAEYEADLHYRGAPPSRDAPGGRTVRRLLQVHGRDSAFREWAAAPELVGRLRQLLGPRIMLSQVHHNCVMTKQPRFSSETGWHQDIRYWSFQRPDLISVWLALGEERPENGGLAFIPGSHQLEFARDRLDPALFLREDLSENAELIDTQVHPTLEPGDVVFFHCRTFHSAGPNVTAATKFSLVFSYHALDNAPLAGTRSASLPPVPL